jgi:DNA-binding winged helix-turn-helix (wHTH) protein
VTHPRQIVTHAELLQAVWADTVVSPEVLKVRIGRLRRLLGDKVAAPRFIANVHGQGYRFLSAVTTQPVLSGQFSVSSSDKARQKSPQLTTDNWQLTTHLVGRETELAQLHSWLDRAINGERQIVFVTGEPGIGKTALLEAFVAEVRDQEKSQIAKVKSY